MSRRVWLWCGGLVGASLLLALACLAPQVPLAPRVAYGLAFAVVTAEILVSARFAPAWGGLKLVAGVVIAGADVLALRGAAPTALHAACLTAGLLGGSTLLGAALGARIERPGHLLAVATVSGLADLWSVLDKHGPTAQMVESALAAPEQLALFALPWPLLGTGSIQPLIGAGDVLFAALYLASFERHGLSVARGVVALALGFAVGLAGLLIFERALPLLPLLGAAVVLADPRARALDARELRAVVTVALALLVLMGARLWG